MNYNVIILQEAKLDIKEITNWYKEINSKLSKRFVLSLKNSIEKVKNNPFKFQIRYNNVRVILLKTFPYLIHFSVINNTIIITAVYHTSRNSDLNNFF